VKESQREGEKDQESPQTQATDTKPTPTTMSSSETATALLGKKRQLKELNPSWNSPKRFRPNEEVLTDDGYVDTSSSSSSSSSAFLDSAEPRLAVSYENILAAAKRIENGVIKSPCRLSKKLSKICGANIFVKNGLFLLPPSLPPPQASQRMPSTEGKERFCVAQITCR